MKEVIEENEKHAQDVAADKRTCSGGTAVGTGEPAQQEVGQQEAEERKLERELEGRSVERQLEGRSLGAEPGESGLVGESLRDRQGLGAGDRRSKLGAEARIGHGL